MFLPALEVWQIELRILLILLHVVSLATLMAIVPLSPSRRNPQILQVDGAGFSFDVTESSGSESHEIRMIVSLTTYRITEGFPFCDANITEILAGPEAARETVDSAKLSPYNLVLSTIPDPDP